MLGLFLALLCPSLASPVTPHIAAALNELYGVRYPVARLQRRRAVPDHF